MVLMNGWDNDDIHLDFVVSLYFDKILKKQPYFSLKTLKMQIYLETIHYIIDCYYL
jgi:hypothetical protein